MKKIIYLLIAGLFSCSSYILAQGNNHPFYTSGKQVLDPCGNEFIIRGVNYSLLDDWDFPGNMNDGGELSAQIIRANPNTVRIQWYVDYGQATRPAYNLSHLDSVLARFTRAGIVSMIELHDLTCKSDDAAFNADLLAWWTDPAVVALVEKYKTHVMVNFANEYGQVNWAANPATAYTAWVNLYKNAITAVRDAGIDVPLVVDGPDCGISLDRVLLAGSTLTDHDPLNRVIMSVHAYWHQYDAAQMDAAVASIENAGFPVIIGEIANIQDATGNCSHEITAYKELLQSCQDRNVGWLAWTWTNDNCPARMMSTNGTFSNLTVYGNTIVNDPGFGLAAQARKACFDASTNAVKDIHHPELVSLSPNPVTGDFVMFKHSSPNPVIIALYDIAGRQLQTWELPVQTSSSATRLDLPSAMPAGVYWMDVRSGTERTSLKLLVP